MFSVCNIQSRYFSGHLEFITGSLLATFELYLKDLIARKSVGKIVESAFQKRSCYEASRNVW